MKNILDKLFGTKYNRMATPTIKNQTKEEEMPVFPKARKAQPKRLTKLTKKGKAMGPVIPYLEVWNTRYGTSERIVYRRAGKFVDSVSLASLKRGVRVSSR